MPKVSNNKPSEQKPQSEAKPAPAAEAGVEIHLGTELEISTGAAQYFSHGNDTPKKQEGTVPVLVEYPDDHDGPKFLPHGEVIDVSEETAEQFIGRGIAKRVHE